MNIVLIARHFPPAISGGARRPVVLRSALERLGHHVFVIAPQLPADVEGLCVPHPAEDRDHDGVVRGPTQPDPLWRQWQRDLLLWPDPDRWWANKVMEEAEGRIKAFAPDLIITSSPPESIHHAGAVLSNRLACRWIADFRDSWLKDSLTPQRQRLYRRVGEARLARRWLRQADLVTAPTAFILQEMRELGAPRATHLYPQLSPPVSHGERPALPTWDAAPEGTIRILHTGSFSLSDPKRLLEPVLDVFDREAPDTARLYIAGRLSAAEHALIKTHTAVNWLGLLSANTARRLQADADALLLVAAPGTSAVPGKLSEYVSAGTPIITIGNGPWLDEATIPSQIRLSEVETLLDARRPESTHAGLDIDGVEMSILNDRADLETRALLTALPPRENDEPD